MTENTADAALTAQEEKMAEIVAKVLKGETIMRAEIGLDENDMEALYAVAYNVYQSGKYQDAVKIFGLLSVLDPTDYRFVFGGASCMQMLGEYMMAGMYYQMAGGLDTANPAPMLHSAECFLALKDRDGAKFALEQALERAGDKAEFTPIKKRAEVMLENLTA
jgi:type III secretion system low calcium response chaperone LcrH/SycD